MQRLTEQILAYAKGLPEAHLSRPRACSISETGRRWTRLCRALPSGGNYFGLDGVCTCCLLRVGLV